MEISALAQSIASETRSQEVNRIDLPPVPSSGGGLSPGLMDSIEGLNEHWLNLEQSAQQLSQSVPAPMRSLYDAQLAMSSLALESQLVSKAGEALSGTLRRLQQTGS